MVRFPNDDRLLRSPTVSLLPLACHGAVMRSALSIRQETFDKHKWRPSRHYGIDGGLACRAFKCLLRLALIMYMCAMGFYVKTHYAYLEAK